MELPLSYHSNVCDDCSDEQRAAKSASVAISETIMNALAPPSPWYSLLWPIVIEQATECQRWRCLRQVNRFFASIDRRIISNKAKRDYFSAHSQDLVGRWPNNMGLRLDRHGEHWSCWGAEKNSFGEIDAFLEFCKLADVDLEADVFSFDAKPLFRNATVDWGLPPDYFKRWVFVSRTRDLVFQTGRNNPLRKIEEVGDEEYACYIRDFGITGSADKVKQLLEYAVAKMGWTVEWGERWHI